MSKWSECAHTSGVWRVCARALWLTLDGGRVWSVVLTQLRGIFLLEDAHCHRSCRFWTVYSRIMMTSLKQTRLLSCIVFLYERSMYPFHSSVTSQTHMPQLHPPHPASLPPNHVKNNRSRNSLLRHDTGEEKKRNLTMTKRSMYPFHSSVARRQRLTEGVSEAWCFKKLFELFDSIIIYGLCIFLLVQNDGSLISEWHKYYSWTNPSS